MTDTNANIGRDPGDRGYQPGDLVEIPAAGQTWTAGGREPGGPPRMPVRNPGPGDGTGGRAVTGQVDARAEIADSLRRDRAWRAEMQRKGLTRDEAIRIASGQQQHEMWQIEQRLTAPDPAEAERRIRDAEPGFQARQRATWNELMALREQTGHGFVIEHLDYGVPVTCDLEPGAEIGS